MATEQAHDELMAELQELLSESEPASTTQALTEADGSASLERKAREKRKNKKVKHLGSGRNPFKNRDHIGTGPRGRTNHKSGKWKCSCKKPYQCVCKAGKRTKVIRIGKDYKRSYNHEYKTGSWKKPDKV